MKNYKKTKLACYLGFITQAVAANFAPLLFLKFHTDYNISLGNIAMISTSFFFTQLLVDLFCAKYVDKIGYRVCIVASEVCSAAGLVGLAFLPEIIPSPFIGIIISVILYAIGSGLIEVLGSPIVEACPFENKEATMSLLHSFYCWGAVGTILVSTVFFLLFGIGNWKWLAVIFALIPAINIINFATCPIESLGRTGNGNQKIIFKSHVPDCHCDDGLFRGIGACNGTMGICVRRISPRLFKGSGRYCRTLYVCCDDGNFTSVVWKSR